MGGEKKKKKERRGERRKGSYVGFICVSVCEMARRQASIFFKCALKKKKTSEGAWFFPLLPETKARRAIAVPPKAGALSWLGRGFVLCKLPGHGAS